MLTTVNCSSPPKEEPEVAIKQTGHHDLRRMKDSSKEVVNLMQEMMKQVEAETSSAREKRRFEVDLEYAHEGFPQAMYRVAEAYNNGKGVDKSLEDAFVWYSRAAEKEHVKSMYTVGKIYDDGTHGITEDNIEAISWYEKAAQKGNIDSAYALYLLYGQGDEMVDKDIEKSRHWNKTYESMRDQNIEK